MTNKGIDNLKFGIIEQAAIDYVDLLAGFKSPTTDCGKCGIIDREGICHPKEHDCSEFACYAVGENDLSLSHEETCGSR